MAHERYWRFKCWLPAALLPRCGYTQQIATCTQASKCPSGHDSSLVLASEIKISTFALFGGGGSLYPMQTDPLTKDDTSPIDCIPTENILFSYITTGCLCTWLLFGHSVRWWTAFHRLLTRQPEVTDNCQQALHTGNLLIRLIVHWCIHLLRVCVGFTGVSAVNSVEWAAVHWAS